MTGSSSSQWRSRWRHLRLHEDSPDLEVAEGVHARIAMTSQAMISRVTMTAGSVQGECSHPGELLIVVVTGQLSIAIGDEQATIVADDVAIVPAGERYALTAGAGGCSRIDVFAPPDHELAEAAFEQEHATHGFE